MAHIKKRENLVRRENPETGKLDKVIDRKTGEPKTYPVWTVYFKDKDGKDDSSGPFTSKKDADAELARIKNAHFTGTLPSSSVNSLPLGPFIAEAANDTFKKQPSTVAKRQAHAKKWLLGQASRPEEYTGSILWADTTIQEITKRSVQAWVEDLDAHDVGASTIRNAFTVLNQAVREVWEQYEIARPLPTDGIKLPSEKKEAQQHERRYLTADEVRELGEAIDSRFTSVIAVLAFLGLRIGELAGLTVGQVTIGKRRIRIDRQATIVGGRLVQGPPKWGMSRTIAYPASLDGVFRKHTAGKSKSQLVFTAARGGYIRSDDWRSDYLEPAIEKATRGRMERAERDNAPFDPFPPIRTHDLRHTAASFAISSGANVKAVQNLLGHKDAAMTLNTYADLFDEDQERVAAAMDWVVRRAGNVEFWVTDDAAAKAVDTALNPLPRASSGELDAVDEEAA